MKRTQPNVCEGAVKHYGNGAYWRLVWSRPDGKRSFHSLGPKSKISEQEAGRIARLLDAAMVVLHDPTLSELLDDLRTSADPSRRVIKDGPRRTNILRVDGEDHRLQPRVWSILWLLWNRTAAPVATFDRAVWPDESPTDGQRRTAVLRANKALENLAIPWRIRMEGGTLRRIAHQNRLQLGDRLDSTTLDALHHNPARRRPTSHRTW